MLNVYFQQFLQAIVAMDHVIVAMELEDRALGIYFLGYFQHCIYLFIYVYVLEYIV